MQAHLSQSVEQTPGVVEQDPRLLAFVHERGNELADPLVAPVEDRRVVVVPDLRRSCPPAGIKGWCMWSATAKVLLMRAKSMPLSRSEIQSPRRVTAATRSSAPQMFGKPSPYSGRVSISSPLSLVDHPISADLRIPFDAGTREG
jgi:hypothetical protein